MITRITLSNTLEQPINKFFLGMVIALASSGAMARTDPNIRWTSIGTSHNEEVSYYLDYQSFRTRGQKVTALELMDFEKPQELNNGAGRYSSSILQIEFDCDKRLSRILSFTMFSGNMGSKEVVYSKGYPSAAWEPVPPNSVEKELWNSVCVKE